MRGIVRRLRSSRWLSLASAVVLVVGVAAGTTGVLAEAAPAGLRPAQIRLTYTCQFPSGPQPATATVAAAFPAAVMAGQQVRPASAQVTASLPPAAAQDVAHTGAATAGGSEQLTMAVTSAGKSAASAWPGQMPSPVSVPASGPLVVTATGPVPAASTGKPGILTFTVAGLDLLLTLRTADGSPADPPAMSVPCTLRPGQDARLASVSVRAATSSPSPSATANAAPKHRRPSPKGCGKIKQRKNGVQSCAYVTGYSDVRKLGEAALLQPARPKRPGLLNVDFAETTKITHSRKGVEIVATSAAKLYYHGRAQLPPVKATFLAFRFVPATAMMQLTELTPIRIRSISEDFSPFGVVVTSRTKVSLRLYNVKVNGQPLNVGAHCEAVRPLSLTLIGRGKLLPRPHGYTVPTGGPLSGEVLIPPFHHCGVGENLNPIFNGTVSGPRNFVIVTQGKLCMPTQPASESVCPPPIPKPRR